MHPRAECPCAPQEQTPSGHMLRFGSSRSQDFAPSERSFTLLLVHRIMPKVIEFFLDQPAGIPPARPKPAKTLKVGAAFGSRQASYDFQRLSVHVDQSSKVFLVVHAARFQKAE